MTPAELEAAGQSLHGPRWQSALARRLGVDRSTIWRQMQKDRIDGPIAAAVECFVRESVGKE